jgi:hypothetical protein
MNWLYYPCYVWWQQDVQNNSMNPWMLSFQYSRFKAPYPIIPRRSAFFVVSLMLSLLSETFVSDLLLPRNPYPVSLMRQSTKIYVLSGTREARVSIASTLLAINPIHTWSKGKIAFMLIYGLLSMQHITVTWQSWSGFMVAGMYSKVSTQ